MTSRLFYKRIFASQMSENEQLSFTLLSSLCWL